MVSLSWGTGNPLEHLEVILSIIQEIYENKKEQSNFRPLLRIITDSEDYIEYLKVFCKIAEPIIEYLHSKKYIDF